MFLLIFIGEIVRLEPQMLTIYVPFDYWGVAASAVKTPALTNPTQTLTANQGESRNKGEGHRATRGRHTAPLLTTPPGSGTTPLIGERFSARHKI
jgi:hypothetical protein